MLAFSPINGQTDSPLGSLVAPEPRNDSEHASRLGSPLGTADNGKAQIDANERPLPLRPPSPDGKNGETTKDSRLGPPSPNGDNGETPKESRLGPPSPNGDNGETTTDSMAAPQHPGPPLPNRYLTGSVLWHSRWRRCRSARARRPARAGRVGHSVFAGQTTFGTGSVERFADVAWLSPFE
jgi:hypothetical protein